MEAVGRLYSHYSTWEKFVDIAHALTINEYLIPTNISGIFSTTRIYKSFKKITNTQNLGRIYKF